ncbi:uncharacterized protein LOC108600489 isoform X2 [Drosophila busckii]|uniref:uncharacterized protein LOC108600489 isoform X2 n=1 Tax=Drosophila busckii TaxID=30019 RepID=UPI0014328B8F|nr:uncharacterized protein LOC108600489 isoform X2 [Drosophila busckii]
MRLVRGLLECLAFLQLLIQNQGGLVQEAKRQIRSQFRNDIDYPRYYGSDWDNGQRVHRIQVSHPQHRWRGRRRSINHHHPFSRWTQWTTCSENCIMLRERFCKAKRQCGHTKHVEQRKCLSCIPSHEKRVPFQEISVKESHHQIYPSQPAIIINAAAAAANGSPLGPQPHPTEFKNFPALHRFSEEFPYSVEKVPQRLQRWRPSNDFSIEDEYEMPIHGEHEDFFVLKRHRRRQKPRPSSYKSRVKPKPNYVDDDFEDYGESHSYLKQRSLGTSAESSSIDGDIFQYEDFKIDQNSQYVDSDDSFEHQKTGNASWLSLSKERNTPDGLLPRYRRVYSKWSRWTKCSPKCTTRRYKKCRINEQCGREVLREIAYCYTEGSFCQQWLHTQVQKAPAYESRPEAASSTAMRRMHTGNMNANVIMSGKGYRGPEYSPPKIQCGLTRSAGQRSMYNMLKIIGGKAARKGEWPWQVAIFNRFKEAFCGGTLIAPLWVLTAAHCVRKVLYVRFGEHNLDYEDGTEVQLRVLKSYKHPNFDKRTVDSDVALLRLPKAVNATSWIGFSCLPRPFQPLPKNVDCTVIGWGKRRNRDMVGTSVLHQADVPIIPMENCRSVYHDYTITKNMFCAGHHRGRIDTCAGDSGGPLLCRDTTKANHPWTIFGITSFGDGCAKRNKFGIYAKVPNYVDWVWSVVNCNGNCKLH